MNHTQLLNYLADKHNLKSYLEIGVQNPANNFNKIKCELKTGIDPEPVNKVWGINVMTSDDFFKTNPGDNFVFKADLIFIDGYHESSQVQRDFENSLRCLNDGGYIVIHDCLPEEEKTSLVPRESKQWHGDVYKFIFKLNSYDGIDFCTYNFDCGCCVVWKDATKLGGWEHKEIDWQFYQLNKKLMRVSDEPVRI